MGPVASSLSVRTQNLCSEGYCSSRTCPLASESNAPQGGESDAQYLIGAVAEATSARERHAPRETAAVRIFIDSPLAPDARDPPRGILPRPPVAKPVDDTDGPRSDPHPDNHRNIPRGRGIVQPGARYARRRTLDGIFLGLDCGTQ